MKLIDLLVQELPKRGGWPEGAVECERYLDEATIDFYDENGDWHVDCGEEYGAIAVKCIKPRDACDGFRKENVKKEEYEAALAASQQPAWNGEGLPPVGCECEVKRAIDWMRCKILFISEAHVVLLGEEECCWQTQACRFRPIRTEGERKRDEAIKELDNVYRAIPHSDAVAYGLYDAIAAGKIPHITLK